MLKLGIIGTGWISSSFVEAAQMTKKNITWRPFILGI